MSPNIDQLCVDDIMEQVLKDRMEIDLNVDLKLACHKNGLGGKKMKC